MRLFNRIFLTLVLAALAVSAYFVKKGDTLWDISDEYLNDPFAWPDLWEKNKHIQDPHWIYPGDSINLGEAPAENSEVKTEAKPAPGPCATAKADSTLPKGVSAPKGCLPSSQSSSFENMLGSLANDSAGIKAQAKFAATSYYYAQRPEPKLFNGFYQVLSPVTISPDSLKSDEQWFSVKSGEKRTPIVHIPETELVVGIGKNTKQKATVGAIVEIWDARRVDLPETKIRSAEKAALMQFSGLAKITDVGDTLSRAVLLQSMREIKIDYAKARLRVEPKPINVSGYTSVKSAAVDSMALVRYAIDKKLALSPYDYILIDRGSENGYSLGDGVAIWEKDLSDSLIPPRLLARGIVTSLTKLQAVILVRESYYGDRRIQYGNLVSITHRATLVK